MPSPIRTWLQLLRAPNLLTVPGDPLAGYLLASFGATDQNLWPAIGASLCFYAGGLLLNDLADLGEDRLERPNRPLPSGAASVTAVAIALVVCFGAAMYLCWQVNSTAIATGGALLLAITAYNLGTKRAPVLGAINMGLCRSLSLLLGTTAAPHGDLTYRLIAAGRFDYVVVPAALVIAYIAAVTHLARFETRAEIPRGAKWLPVAVLVAGGFLFLRRLETNGLAASGPLFLIAVASAVQVALRLEREPATPVPAEIGNLIRTMLLIQAGFCASIAAPCAAFGNPAGYLATVILVLLWPISRLLGRWFYAS